MNRPAHMGLSDADLESRIAECGRRMVKAHENGDPFEQRVYLEEQNRCIAARSRAQVQDMEGCYFSTQGANARAGASL